MDIYIANLTKNASFTSFWDRFSTVGIVREVEIVRAADMETGRDFAVIQLDAFPETLKKVNQAANAMQETMQKQNKFA
jgi:hypothetical protein